MNPDPRYRFPTDLVPDNIGTGIRIMEPDQDPDLRIKEPNPDRGTG